MKTLKNGPQKLLIIGPNLFFHSPAHRPKLISDIINMSQDSSVSLFVVGTLLNLKENKICCKTEIPIIQHLKRRKNERHIVIPIFM